MSFTDTIKKYIFYLKDVIWSTIAVVLLNVILQFLLYPTLRNVLGAETYGDILYLLGITNIIAIAVGNSASMARIKASTEQEDNSRDYSKFLILVFSIILPVCAAALYSGNTAFNAFSIFLYWVLTCAMAYRYYASVQYRLTINYKGYFIYHLTICLGYIVGIALFYLTRNWFLIFIPGELAGGVLSFFQTRSKRTADKKLPSQFSKVLTSISLLVVAQLLVNLVFNADRLLLKIFVSSTAVTIYYVSSLIGKTVALITEPINNVVIGHLAKREGTIESRLFLKIIGLILVGAFLAVGVCVLGSHIFVYLFYPNEYEMAKNYFLLANFAQIMYFASGIVSTILLRYVKVKFQLYMNIFYACIFLSVTLPLTAWGGMKAFALSLCLVNTSRFLFGMMIGVRELKRLGKDK